MIKLDQDAWADLVMAMTNKVVPNSYAYDHKVIRKFLAKHYRAEYFNVIDLNYSLVYYIEFTDPKKETFFKLKYAEYL